MSQMEQNEGAFSAQEGFVQREIERKGMKGREGERKEEDGSTVHQYP